VFRKSRFCKLLAIGFTCKTAPPGCRRWRESFMDGPTTATIEHQQPSSFIL